MDILLAIIQGISEIYPVSSAGHLVVFGVIIGAEVSFGRVVLFHLGSVIAIAIFYRRLLSQIATGNYGWQMHVKLLASFLVTAAAGLLFEQFARTLTINPIAVARLWLLNAAILFLFAVIARTGERDIGDLGLRDFLIIGLAQALGTLPGISRLGITLGAALLCKMKWSQAVALSFLLSLPVIIFASLWQFFDFSLIQTAEIPFVVSNWLIEFRGLRYLLWSIYPDLFLGGVTFLSSLFALHQLTKVVYLGRRLFVFFAVYSLVGGVFFPLYLSLF